MIEWWRLITIIDFMFFGDHAAEKWAWGGFSAETERSNARVMRVTRELRIYSNAPAAIFMRMYIRVKLFVRYGRRSGRLDMLSYKFERPPCVSPVWPVGLDRGLFCLVMYCWRWEMRKMTVNNENVSGR